MSEVSPSRCAHCAAGLDSDQRYCLGCGARIGPRPRALERLLQSVGAGAGENGAPGVTGAALALPGARVSILLILVFLGFGVILGAVSGSHAEGPQVSARPALKLQIASAAAAAESTTTQSTPPPIAQQTPTPEPSSQAAAPQTSSSQRTAAPPRSSGAATSKGRQQHRKAKQPEASPKLPAIAHVFVIMLDDAPYASVFGPSSAAPYIAHRLEKKGELLVRYYAVAHQQLANELALLSGQGPTEETAANCPTYTEITPARSVADEQLLGNGCVYPGSTRTLMNELVAKHLTWNAYIQGTDEGGSTPPVCAYPPLGASDPTATASSGTYATFSNPFVYFESITGSSECQAHDDGLGALKNDLADIKKTANFSYIAPDLCDDANPVPCQPGKPAGVSAADPFLRSVVPEILASPAYKRNGLLVITTSQAPSSGEFADSSSCCGQPRFPNLPAPRGPAALSPSGGGEVGALLLSPFAKADTLNQGQYSHFSLLRSIEDLFGLEHLGYAGLDEVKPFAASVFTAPAA